MAEFLSAGTKFKIGSTVIAKLKSTPDMGSEPDRRDISSQDNEKYRTYLLGLMDLGNLTFEFWDDTTNFNAAYNAENAGETTYEVDYPDGSKYTWKGTHRTYKLATSVGEPVSFAIACTISSEPVYTTGTGKE